MSRTGYSRTIRNWLLLGIVVLIVVAVDQLTKGWIVQNLAPGESLQPIPALSRFFQITHSANTGAAFGLLPQSGDLFVIIAPIIVLAMLYFYPRLPDGAWWTRIAIGLICGGALGNVIDRVRYEHVVDFIHYQLPGVISNVSNLADHAIVLGVIVVLLDSWRMERHQTQMQSAEPDTSNIPDDAQPAGQTGPQKASHNSETPL
ncbi:MAG TPA: signal peptidase II [Phototrophicaceae bacterium]|nr:signal peptidase II [Phototrophicaceae bacterium]